MDVHNPDAAQAFDLVSECLTHATDLTVQPLGQGNIEFVFGQGFDLAGQSLRIKDFHALGHMLYKFRGDGVVDLDDILFFVLIFRAEDLIDDITVVGQQDQPFRILVEPSDMEDPQRGRKVPDPRCSKALPHCVSGTEIQTE